MTADAARVAPARKASGKRLAQVDRESSPIVRMNRVSFPRTVVREAEALIDARNFDEAQRLIESIEGWSRTFEGNNLNGTNLAYKNDMDAAEAAFSRALVVSDAVHDMEQSSGLANLANCKLQRGEYGKAIALCDAALEFDARHSTPWVVKLGALNKAGRQGELRAVFEEADRRWPQWRADPQLANRLANDEDLDGVASHVPRAPKERAVR